MQGRWLELYRNILPFRLRKGERSGRRIAVCLNFPHCQSDRSLQDDLIDMAGPRHQDHGDHVNLISRRLCR